MHSFGRWCVGLACLGLLFSTGCVQRRLTVRTFPENATVYVDDQEIGQSPAATSFVHYGVRNIRVEKQGFETVEVAERVMPPWYLTPGLDFFVENFWPAEIRDERIVEIELPPQQLVPQTELVQRAENLRNNVQQGLVVPAAEERGRGGGLFHHGQRNN